jgi:hypothetical protein
MEWVAFRGFYSLPFTLHFFPSLKFLQAAWTQTIAVGPPQPLLREIAELNGAAPTLWAAAGKFATATVAFFVVRIDPNFIAVIRAITASAPAARFARQ